MPGPVSSVAAAPLVSVVLPVRDAAGTVARAVQGIRAQTLADWELVIVDDGSIDGTREILEEVRRADPRVRVLVRPRDGIVAALNAGVAAARGAFVARMDAPQDAE